MDIHDLLHEDSCRISIGNRWLVHDGEGEWHVFEHKYRSKAPYVLYRGYNEADAVKAMLKD